MHRWERVPICPRTYSRVREVILTRRNITDNIGMERRFLKRINGETGKWLVTVGCLVGLLFSVPCIKAQGVVFVYDPVRHQIVKASNNSNVKQFANISGRKAQTIYNKEQIAANYLVLNILEEHLYNKEKSLKDGNLQKMKELYTKTVRDIDEFWKEYERIYLQSSDTLRQKCQTYFDRAKKNSDYEMSQIRKRVNRYVDGNGFIANSKERIVMMESCYKRVKAEKARVIRHGRVLFSLAVYRKEFDNQRVDILESIVN